MVQMYITPTIPQIARREGYQMAYLLVGIGAAATPNAPAVPHYHVAVVDTSSSMRAPIASDEQFRQQVQTGIAHEVLINGIPAWQFAPHTPEAATASAPNPLAYVASALEQGVALLRPTDQFALVAFAHDTRLLVPAVPPTTHRAALLQGLRELLHPTLGDETHLVQGLRMALMTLRQTAPATPTVRQLTIITDGFIADPLTCLELARQAASEGITLHTIGIGNQFSDDLLVNIADLTGGTAVVADDAAQVPHLLPAVFAAAQQMTAAQSVLRVTLAPGVRLRHATALTPALAVLQPQYITDTLLQVTIGGVTADHPRQVLLELEVPPARRSVGLQNLVALEARTGIPAATVEQMITAQIALEPAIPDVVIDAAARATALRHFRRARAAVKQHDPQNGSRLLRQFAGRLAELGEPSLAALAQQEAINLQHSGKERSLLDLNYATRRLVPPDGALTADDPDDPTRDDGAAPADNHQRDPA